MPTRDNSTSYDTPDLVVLGQATIDDIFREGEGMVSPETPGGDSIYAVLGASIWPLSIGVVTVVGEDYPYHKLQTATYNPARTDWSGVVKHDGPSIHDRATYYADGRRTYTFREPSLLDILSPSSKDIPLHMASSRYVHIAPASTRHQLDILRFYKAKGATVSLDVESHFVEQGLDYLLGCFELDPIFVPSIEHIQMLSGTASRNLSDLWHWIAASGLSLMIIKCGHDGALVVDVKKRQYWHIGIVQHLTLVDVTGAGDSFCGGFMAGYFLTGDVVKAAAYGAVSASFIIESLGATRSPIVAVETAWQRLGSLLKTTPAATAI